ncbi:winged helix-turn-helix domain-containing protein [Stenotrophomonas sp. TWI1183]|uniref:winged helix-turn-helix domain-containing protein n=1 Tax=Stenotrophomonas sp. TWI1183 TaxID=3136799 RepID=UPI0032088AD9
MLQPSAEVTAEREVPLHLAYQAGVVGFAQLVAAQAASKRAPDRVQDIARSTPLAPYIAELQRGGQTNSRLAELTGETEETVSRKLKKLRRHGISAFRRDGRVTTNYLTPLGRALADISSEPALQEAGQQSQAAESKLIKQVLVKQMEARVQPDPHLRDLAILGADAENSDAPRCAYGR